MLNQPIDKENLFCNKCGKPTFTFTGESHRCPPLWNVYEQGQEDQTTPHYGRTPEEAAISFMHSLDPSDLSMEDPGTIVYVRKIEPPHTAVMLILKGTWYVKWEAERVADLP